MTRWNRSKRKIKEKGDERIFSLVFRTNDPRLGSKFCSVYGGCLGSQFLLVKPFFETIYAPRNPRILWILSPIPFREPMEIYPSHFYFTKRLDNRPNFPPILSVNNFPIYKGKIGKVLWKVQEIVALFQLCATIKQDPFWDLREDDAMGRWLTLIEKSGHL